MGGRWGVMNQGGIKDGDVNKGVQDQMWERIGEMIKWL